LSREMVTWTDQEVELKTKYLSSILFIIENIIQITWQKIYQSDTTG
jgi:hypothetical protein